jgi:hypothetical protein
MKVWMNHSDVVLSNLSKALVNRKLFKIKLQDEPFDEEKVDSIKSKIQKKYHLSDEEIGYFVFQDTTSNYTYIPGIDKIKMLLKNGSVMDITEASDQLNINMLSKPTVKYFLCYPKNKELEF